jgi:L-malate glycosyltransferase
VRIVHLNTQRGWRGGERQTLWLARELARMGHESVVAARPDQPLIARARAEGLPTISCAPRFETDPGVAWRLRRELLARGAEILHAHTGHAVGLGALSALGSATELVAARRVDFRLRDNFVTRWKYGRTAAVIAVSGAVAAIVEGGGVPAGKIEVVPDGTDTDRVIEPASRATLRSLGVSTGAPLVVQVSQLVGHKDPLNFVRAIAVARRTVPSLQALLVGDGSLRTQVESLARELGLDGALVVAGYRHDADSLLAAADIVTLSSREEGMGSVLLDALLLGKPIVATRAGGIPEVVSDRETGLLVPPEDPEALGTAIARVAKDSALAARISEAAGRSVHEFSVARMAERTVGIYRRVLSRRSAG